MVGDRTLLFLLLVAMMILLLRIDPW